MVKGVRPLAQDHALTVARMQECANEMVARAREIGVSGSSDSDDSNGLLIVGYLQAISRHLDKATRALAIQSRTAFQSHLLNASLQSSKCCFAAVSILGRDAYPEEAQDDIPPFLPTIKTSLIELDESLKSFVKSAPWRGE